MIVSMRKVTILVLDSRRDRELASLKRLGLLHPNIERRSSPGAEELEASRDTISRSLLDISTEADREQAPLPGMSGDVVSLANDTASRIARFSERIRSLTEELEKLRREHARVEPWGQFDPRQLKELAEHGIDIRLFTMGQKEFRRRAPEGAIVLGRSAKRVRFALIWHQADDSETAGPDSISARPDVQAFAVPEMSAREMLALIGDKEDELTQEKALLSELGAYQHVLASAIEILDHRIEHEYVRAGMDTAERVAYISGFVPVDSESRLREAAVTHGWGLLLQTPDPDEPVPTKIRNPRWIRTIRPMFNMLGVMPGYRERDISMWFLLFFTVFVGMIIGDAGYGALLLIGSIFGIISGKRRKGQVSEGITLLAVLSLSTLAWGAITGNWFGYEPISKLRPFSFAVVPVLNTFDPRSTQAVQSVCFILAATQLSIAHIWNFIREIREKPAVKAFAQLGWLSAVLGLYFLVVSLFLGQAMPQYALYMIAGGVAGVFIFSGQTPEKGFFGGIGRGLSNAFTIIFDGIGAFSDIISYIRLFAVGLASVAIAQAFNEMAASVASSPVGAVLAAVILFFGHSLNLVMGGLAVVVHGVRLNLLEFSGHLGMEWTGVEYRPFAESE